MRWFVEISPLGQKAGPSTTLCVEAPQWQPALQKARAMRGDDGAMSNFSIELLEEGFRAIDPATRLRFVVKRAPDDAALSATPTPAPAAPKPLEAQPAPPVAVPAPDAKKRPMAQTVAFISPGAAVVNPPAPEPAPQPAPVQPAPAPAAPVIPTPAKRPPAQTVVFSSTGAAAVRELAPAPEAAAAKPAPEAAAAKPAPEAAAAKPAPAAVASVPKPRATAPAGEPAPSFVLVGAREDNPTESSPLTYREFVYAVGQGTSEDDARRLILDRFDTVLASIDHVRAGKLINLAVFDHVFHGKPLRRPLVTLTWKDWKSDPPEIRFPEREGGAPSSRSMTPLATPAVPPSAVAAVAAQAQAIAPVPAAAPAAKPAAAPEPRKPSEPAARLATSTLSSAQSSTSPKPEVEPEVPVVVAAPQPAVVAAPQPAAAPVVPAPRPIKVTEPSAGVQAPKAAAAVAAAPPPAKVATEPFVKPIIAIEAPREAAPASVPVSSPESGVVPTLASPVHDAPSAAPVREPSSPPKAAAPIDAPKAAPAAAASSRPAAPRKRLSGDDLLAELFEAFGDLQFLRDSLEGAEFVLALTLEQLPCEVGLVSLFDMNTREFVVVRQSGGQGSALCARQPERAPVAGNAMRKRRAIVVSDPAGAAAAMDDRFRAAGVEIRSLVTTPVELGGRYLGLIELVNPLDGGVFSEGDGNALTYIGEQFAEFVAAHGVIVDPEQIRAPPKALYDGAASGPKARAPASAAQPGPSNKRSK
jgi:GAF domain